MELNVYLSEFIIVARINEEERTIWAVLSQRNLIKRWPLSYKAWIWEKAIHWSRIYEIERFIEGKAKRTEKKQNKTKQKKAEEISRMQLLFSQRRKLISSLKKRSWEQLLHNRYRTLCAWIIFYTSVSEVAQNNEIQSYVRVMLFSRLTVKAKDMLFIQRDKRRAKRRQLTEC